MEVLRPRSQREKLHTIPHIIERDQRGDECQIVDRTADGYPQLVTIDHSGKVSMLPLPVGSQHEKIPVLCEYDAAKLKGPLQKPVIVPVGSPILVGREYVDLPLPQANSYGHRHMVVQIEGEAQSRRVPWSFARFVDEPCWAASLSTSLSCSRMSASKASWWSW